MPALVTDDGQVLTQSLAIIDYLDETRARRRRYYRPTPKTARECAASRSRSRATSIRSTTCACCCTCRTRSGVAEEQKDAWYKYWIDIGLEALETQLSRDPATGRFCHGDAPTLADICLVPQLANARRMNIDVAPYPTLNAHRRRVRRAARVRRRGAIAAAGRRLDGN